MDVALVLQYASSEPPSHIEARTLRVWQVGEDGARGEYVPLATCVHV